MGKIVERYVEMSNDLRQMEWNLNYVILDLRTHKKIEAENGNTSIVNKKRLQMLAFSPQQQLESIEEELLQRFMEIK